MGRIALFLLLLTSTVYGQGDRMKPVYSLKGVNVVYWVNIPGYTNINTRYKWIATAVDSGLHVPQYNGVPTDRVGVWMADGCIAADTLNGHFYYRQGGVWTRVAKYSEIAPILTATQVGFGSGANLLTSSANMTFDATTGLNIESARTFQPRGIAITNTVDAVNGGSILLGHKRVGNMPILNFDALGSIAWRGWAPSGWPANEHAGVLSVRATEDWTNTANGTYMTFEVTTTGTQNIHEVMRVSGDNYVSINSATHEGALDVTGAIVQRGTAVGNTSTYMNVNEGDQTSTTNLNPGLLLYRNPGTINQWGMDLGYLSATTRYRSRIFTPTGGDISFAYTQGEPTAQSSFEEIMTIRGDNQRVGIGTTAPTSKLHVVGDAQFGTAGTTLGQILISGNTSGTVTIQPAAAAGTATLTLPGVTGTFSQFSQSTISSSATPTPSGNARENVLTITALAAGATFAAPSGTALDNNTILIKVKDNGGAQTLAFNAIYRGSTDIALPTTTTAGLWMYMYFVYNATDSKFDLVGLTNGF